MLASLDRLIERLAEAQDETVLQRHASIAYWATLSLMALPAVLLLAGTVFLAMRHGDHFYVILRAMLAQLPAWMLALPLIPAAFTLSACRCAHSFLGQRFSP